MNNIKSEFFTFQHVCPISEKPLTVEVELLHLPDGNKQLGGYCVVEEGGQLVLKDISDEVLCNELSVWMSTQRVEV